MVKTGPNVRQGVMLVAKADRQLASARQAQEQAQLLKQAEGRSGMRKADDHQKVWGGGLCERRGRMLRVCMSGGGARSPKVGGARGGKGGLHVFLCGRSGMRKVDSDDH